MRDQLALLQFLPCIIFHLKLTISSKELKKMSKLDATKKINNILKDEIKNYIHSIQILFD